jgi:hypothetical protein
VKSGKFFIQKKQRIKKSPSTAGGYALLDIVCFAEMKWEEKQQDGAAFQDLP